MIDFLLGPDLSVPYLLLVGAAVVVTALFVAAVIAVMLEDHVRPRDDRTLADLDEIRPLHPIDRRPWVRPDRRRP